MLKIKNVFVISFRIHLANLFGFIYLAKFNFLTYRNAEENTHWLAVIIVNWNFIFLSKEYILLDCVTT